MNDATFDKPRSTSSRSRYCKVAGLDLHYLDYGTSGRPPMLCLHGGAAHAHWYDFVAGPFTERTHCMSLDLRGHGDSGWDPNGHYSYYRYAEDVAEFVAVNRLGPIVLVGHSMGGMVSLVVAAHYPEVVERLIVVDSTMIMSADRVSNLRGVGERKGSHYPDQATYVERFNVRPKGSVASAAVMRHMGRHACREFDPGEWRNKFDRNVYARREPIDGFELWPKVRSAALLIKGMQSDRITAEVEQRVRSLCPQVQFAAVSDSHHHVMLDNPHGFVRAVAPFLPGG